MRSLFLSFFIILSIPFLTRAATAAGKTTLIMVHGAPANKKQFYEFAMDREINEKFNYVIYDRPGYGKRIKVDHYFDYNEQVKDLVGLVNQSKQPVVLVGYSYATTIVMKVAQLIPKKIKHLVLISGAYKPENVANSFLYSIPEVPETLAGLSDSTSGLWQTYLCEWKQAYLEIQNFKKDLAATLSGLKQIQSPITALHGRDDPHLPIQDLQVLADSQFFPRKPILYIRENKGHDLIKTDVEFIKNLLLKL